MRERNRKIFEAKEFREIKGSCEHNGYVIVMARGNGQPRFAPLTFKKSVEGWTRTNELSADEVFDIVFSALMNGGEVKGGETPDFRHHPGRVVIAARFDHPGRFAARCK